MSKGSLCGSTQYCGLARDQAGIGEHRLQIEFSLLRGFAGQDLQHLGVADQFGEGAHAHGGHDLAAFLCDELEVVHDHLGQADEELGAQHVVLGGNTRGAVVQMADAQVLAAQCHHRRGAEAETFGADERGLDDIEAGLQAAVRLQPHAMPQLIGAQGLMRLGQAELPRRAGVLDRGQGARARAAVVAGDRDEVRVGLGNPRGHRSNARLRDQLNGHQGFRIDLLQIERSTARDPRSNRYRDAAAGISGPRRGVRSASARSCRSPCGRAAGRPRRASRPARP